MGSSDSEHRVYTSSAPRDIAEVWAHLRWDDDRRGWEYCSREYTLFINGILVNGYAEFDNVDSPEEFFDTCYALGNEVHALTDQVYAELLEKDRRQKEEAAAAELASKEATRRRLESEQEAQDLATYKRLKEKFGHES